MIMEECKRCLLFESAQGNTLELIKDKINSLPEAEKTDESVYSNRLSLCKNCDFLISGMCRKCGCYVEFRAAFKNKHCPNVNDRKW